jgi:hypothetical protein
MDAFFVFGLPCAKAPVGLCVAILYSFSFHKRISTAIPHPKKGLREKNRQEMYSADLH